MDGTYITPQQKNETSKVYKRRIYNIMLTLLRETLELPIMRVSRLWATWTRRQYGATYMGQRYLKT